MTHPKKPATPPHDPPAVRPSIPTARVEDPDALAPKGKKGPDPTIFVGGVSRPKQEESAVLLVDSKRAFIAITAGPRKGAQFTIQGDKMLIGREPPVDLIVDDRAASRRHAQVYRKSGKWYLKDLGSTNGTYLDGPLRSAERILWDGDVFRIGEWEFTFSDPGSTKK